MTKTKTKTAARTLTRVDRNRIIAGNRINALIFPKPPEPLYDLHIDFDLADWQDFQIVDKWLDTKEAELHTGLSSSVMNAMHCGSGTSFVTGKRDLHFRGTERALLRLLHGMKDHGDFRISKISVYLVESYNGGDDSDNNELRGKITRFFKNKERRFLQQRDENMRKAGR